MLTYIVENKLSPNVAMKLNQQNVDSKIFFSFSQKLRDDLHPHRISTVKFSSSLRRPDNNTSWRIINESNCFPVLELFDREFFALQKSYVLCAKQSNVLIYVLPVLQLVKIKFKNRSDDFQTITGLLTRDFSTS